MNLYHYIYISQTSSSMSSAELNAILRSANRFNERQQITGMLLYCKQTFMQLLEGSKDAVYALMDQRISQDSRHHSIYVVKEAAITERSFKQWSMGFSNLDNVDMSLNKHYTKFLEKGFTVELSTTELHTTHELLLSFREQ